MVETPTQIRSKFGDMLLIEHYDEEKKPKTWVLALNSGLQCRTGPRRLYVRLARHLAKQGYGVIRADLPGVGDSEGPTPPTHFDLHDPTNVRNIVEYVMTTHEPDNVVLLGLCSGARAAIKAGKLNPEVAGVIALSMPTYTASPGSTRSPEEPKNRLSRARGMRNVERLKNAFRKKKYADLSVWRKYLNPIRAAKEIRRQVLSIWFLKFNPNGSNHLGYFISTLVSYSKECNRVLFLFGERDKILCDEFRELGLDLALGNVVEIPDGTHTFSTYSSHRQVIEEASRWLGVHFSIR